MKVILKDLLERPDKQGFVELHDMMVVGERYWVVTTLEAGESYISDSLTGATLYRGCERACAFIKGYTWKHTMKKINDFIVFGVKAQSVIKLLNTYADHIEPDYYRETDGVHVPYWFGNRLLMVFLSDGMNLYNSLNTRYMNALCEVTKEDIGKMHETNELPEGIKDLVFKSGDYLYFRTLPECRPCTGGFIGKDLRLDWYGRDGAYTKEALVRELGWESIEESMS